MLERRRQRLLDSDGAPIELTPRLFSGLLLFVEHPGELIAKASMMETLWPGLVVEENNINQVIAGLRRALGDDAHDSRFIQTVPRRGFRFVASVTPLLSEAAAPVPLSAPPPDRARRRQLAALAGVVAIGMGAWIGRRWTAGPAPAAPAASVAVLPFRSIADSEADKLLGIGMAESLAERMSRVQGLVVRTVLPYVKPGADPLRVAHEIDVAWVVDGSLQHQGDQLRATARLLRARDGVAVWSGSFDEKMVGVFQVQDQIASRLLQALAPVLNGVAPPAVGLPEIGGTQNVEAYQLYLTARWRAQEGRADAIDKSLALLRQALEIDPGFAQAWTLMAWTHRRQLWNADVVPEQVFGSANEALRRALAVEPRLAHARAGLGFSRYWWEFDWGGAERDFRASLAMQPTPDAHHGLSQLLATQDRIEEGLAHIRQACELDPMSPVFCTLEAGFLISYGRLAQARVRIQRALDLQPQQWLAHLAQGELLFAEKDSEGGIAACRRAVQFARGTSRASAVLGAHLAESGRQQEARAILDALLDRAKQRFVPPTSLAAVHAALGEQDPALTALEKGLRVRDTRLIYLKDDPRWATLRASPRFQRLLAQLQLDRFGRGLTTV